MLGINIMSKSALSLMSVGVVGLSWIFWKIHRTLSNSAPLGYEDDAGFHFGAPVKEE
jgi:hypothetical protein